MIDDVLISRTSNLTGFDVMQLDPLPLPLSLHRLLGVVAG
jgi:hypothetical protein